MSPHSLWTLLLKIAGLYFIFECLTVIPQSIGALVMTMKVMDSETPLASLFILLTLVFYILAIWAFLFKSEWIIARLKLDKHFKEVRFELNINRNSIIQIAIILLGATIIVETLPLFCSQIFSFYQSKDTFSEFNNSYFLVLQFVKLIIGYLLISNNRQLTSLFERKVRIINKPIQ